MIYAMDGGRGLHRHLWQGRRMAHLVSTNRELLLEYGRAVGLSADRLQFKRMKDPRTGIRRDAWHWDLGGPVLPAPAPRYQASRSTRAALNASSSANTSARSSASSVVSAS